MHKKILFTLQALFISAVVSSQPLIINSTDIPVPAAPFNNVEYTPVGPPAPSLGDSLTWDYSAYNGTVMIPNVISPETDVFFTGAGIDISREGWKDLNSSASYSVNTKFDFNANGVYESGIAVPYQGYDLSAVTGSSLDSLIFPDQKYLLGDPITHMEFPFTAHSSWHSASRRSVDFDLTVALFSLNHAPGQHVYTKFRNDSIVGWGKMRVYTTSGPSMYYDVLMNRFEEYTIDSFFLNGSPASQILLDAFTVAQGQKTNAFYGYDFMRPGSFNYLVRFVYADSLYSFVSGSFQNTDNITGVPDPNDVSYSTLVFPNPVSANEVNIRISGGNFVECEYAIHDMSGRKVQEGMAESVSEIFSISFNKKLKNGNYQIRMKDKSGKIVLQETITVQK